MPKASYRDAPETRVHDIVPIELWWHVGRYVLRMRVVR